MGGIAPFVKLLVMGMLIIWVAPNTQQFFNFVAQTDKRTMLFNWTIYWQRKPVVGFIAGVTAPAGKRMGHAGALISGGADTAQAKLEVMEECGFKVTRNPSEMAKLLKASL